MPYQLTLRSKEQLTPDTYRYLFDKPAGLDFKPGQAAKMAIMKDGWKDERRSFTFTSLPDEDVLEFVIKSYPDHGGVTQRLAGLVPGDGVEISEPYGAIQDHGPGVFIAAGAGITPFIPILQTHAAEGDMDCTLIFTNETEKDIILRDKWEQMAGLKTIFTVTDDSSSSLLARKVDKSFLEEHLSRFDGVFYLCGPQGFVDDLRDALSALGADADKIITEEGW